MCPKNLSVSYQLSTPILILYFNCKDTSLQDEFIWSFFNYPHRNSQIRSILRQIPAFQLSEQTVDFEMPMPVNGDEKNGDIVKFSFLNNQTSRFSRTGAFIQLTQEEGIRRHFVEVCEKQLNKYMIDARVILAN